MVKITWSQILDYVNVNLLIDKTRSRLFFSKVSNALTLLLNFLVAHTEGRAKDYLENYDKFVLVKMKADLNSYDTTNLIRLYYQRIAGLQVSLRQADNGKLYCMAYYFNKTETLVVQGKR